MVKFNENKQLDNERKVRLLANTETIILYFYSSGVFNTSSFNVKYLL